MSITIRKRHVHIAIVAIILLSALAAAAYFASKTMRKQADYLTPEGLLKLPERQTVKYTEFPYEDNLNYTITGIVYESAGADIHGLLLEPKKTGKVAGVVLLPGAGVDKSSELPVARAIASLGYAVLTIDQRGTGETGGSLPPLEEDYRNYAEGSIAYWHLPVIDALVAADVLSTRQSVDPGNIILVGESYGGRVAMIAGAIDARMKGVVAISSAGLHYRDVGDAGKDRFVRSVDPDNYVSLISPRKLTMIHSVRDTVVQPQSAAVTFDKAQSPKLFLMVNDTSCRHGYCDSMLGPLNFSLAATAGG